MAMTPLPALDRTSATFKADVDAFFGTRLPTFTTEANALQTDVTNKQVTASDAATTATTKASEALTSANNAATSKTGADSARDAAVVAKNAAEAALDSFDDRYLGAKATAPTADNDGAALLTGALYWDTALPGMRSWNGGAWVTLPAATAAAISNTPAGSIAATTVQAAINELDTEKVSNSVVLPDITDLNTVVTSGFYRLRSVSNGPSGTVDDGQLIVSRGLDTITQIAASYLSGRMFTRSGNPPDVGGVGGFTPWREVYTSGSILGTVSQSAGVPTGAVIERGGNANGEYVRFADGTQICSIRSTFSVAEQVPWTYPAAFSQLTYLSASTDVAQPPGYYLVEVAATSAGGATLFRFTRSNLVANPDAFLISAIAVGRWF